MSRIAKAPIELPSGVEIKFNDSEVSVKGPKGNLVQVLHANISLEQEDKTITIKPAGNADIPMAGTFRSLVNNMVVGVSDGFEKKLKLVGVSTAKCWRPSGTPLKKSLRKRKQRCCLR